jgi:hypothetical protein
MQAVVDAGHAPDVDVARAMLNQSELPVDTSEEECIRWAEIYTAWRDKGKTVEEATSITNKAYKKKAK